MNCNIYPFVKDACQDLK